MLGFDADQGRRHYEALGAVAAAELGWSADEAHAQFRDLTAYADSLRV
jgi:hypothetical protein